jgi:PAS domain-containing protein
LRLDASEPIGSVDAPVILDGDMPQLTDLIDQAVLLIDTRNTVVFCNRGAVEMIGLDRGDIVGSSLGAVIGAEAADRLIRAARTISLADAAIGSLVRLSPDDLASPAADG